MKNKKPNWQEFLIPRLIKVCGYSAILFVALIFFFLLREGLPALGEVKLGDLFSIRWYPIEVHFGILPLITGSLIITLGAMLIALPFGIGTAIFMSEIAPRWLRELLKPLVDIPRLADAAKRMTGQAIEAFVSGDTALAKKVILSDSEADELKRRIEKELVYDYMVKDGSTADRAVPLLLAARHLERVCDHAVSMAEDIVYMVSAVVVRHHPEELK